MSNFPFTQTNMDIVRNNYYSPRSSDIRASIGRTKKITKEIKEIYDDYIVNKNNSVKRKELEIKWDSHLEKLKNSLKHLKRIQIDFNFPEELINSRLSTFNSQQLSAFTSEFISASTSTSESTISTFASTTSTLARINIESHESKPNINSSSSENITIINSNDRNDRTNKQKSEKSLSTCSTIDNPLKNKSKIINNQSPLHTQTSSKDITTQSSNPIICSFKTFIEVVPTKRSGVYEDETLLKRVKHYSSNDNDNNQNLVHESRQKDKKKNVEKGTKIKVDPDFLTRNGSSSSVPSELQEISNELIQSDEKNEQNEHNEQNEQNEQNEPIDVSVKFSPAQDIRKEVFSSSYFIQTNSYESEVQKVYEQSMQENELEKASLLKKQNDMINKAKNLNTRKDLPKNLDEAAKLMTYMALNDIVMQEDLDEMDDNRFTIDTKPVVGLTLNKESILKIVLKNFENYKSYNFKCGSGDVNETAMDYSDPVNPRLAMAYIANVDPNYNMTGNLQLLDIASGAAYNLYGHHSPDTVTKEELWTTVTDVKFSSDGKFLFSASTDATIKIWNFQESKKFQKPFDAKVCQSSINRIAVSNYPKAGTTYQFASCEESGMVQVHSIRRDYNQYDLSSHEFKEETCEKSANDILFNSMGDTLIAGYNGCSSDSKGVVKIWDINSRKKGPAHKCQFTCSVSCIDISKNGKLVACGTTGFGNEIGDGSMWIWDIRSQCRTQTKCDEKDANVIAISPNDFYIALGGTSNNVYVFDTRQLNTILRVLRHEEPNDGLPHDGIMSLQWIPDSNILLSGGNDNCVKIWNIGDFENRLIYQFTNHDSPVTSIRISPDFKLMTVGVSTGKMYIYSTNQNFIDAGNKLKYL
ncbi:hypothetical protein Glove_541g47 [Diversispora epigaea]|uniref:Uncharacterized protein n=1 Tax=Diversispora epigaea TaxID=1348612 RepID=A0A397GCY9_9GLOM|nr:hypothetical protein Glove_541g47 [Diversispora epigaea]